VVWVGAARLQTATSTPRFEHRTEAAAEPFGAIHGGLLDDLLGGLAVDVANAWAQVASG
jgi:hypothetical protein